MAVTSRAQQSPPPPAGRAARLVVLDAVDPAAQSGPEIRVVIAYGDPLARAGLTALLEVEPGISVAGSAGDGPHALDLAAQIRPDVLVVDVAVPGVDGVEVTRRIHDDPHLDGVHVLILGGADRDEDVFASLRAGARGFLPRDVEPTELADGVRAIACGQAALTPELVRRAIAEIVAHPDPGLPGPESLDELTPREREVMGLVAAGLSNNEIAEHLVISRSTAKTHVSRTLLKLHARDRAQLVTLAYETGLVLPRQPTNAGFGVTDATLALA